MISGQAVAEFLRCIFSLGVLCNLRFSNDGYRICRDEHPHGYITGTSLFNFSQKRNGRGACFEQTSTRILLRSIHGPIFCIRSNE